VKINTLCMHNNRIQSAYFDKICIILMRISDLNLTQMKHGGLKYAVVDVTDRCNLKEADGMGEGFDWQIMFPSSTAWGTLYNHCSL
jgi:hypothetical protein